MLDFFLKWSGIKEAIVSIFLFLDAIIYSFISYVYQIFLVLAGTNDIVDDSFIDGFINRLYLIIGVVALFIIAYSLLKMMLNPDEGLKGKNSPTKIIFNIISSIVLVALIPTIFNFAYVIQNSLLTQNTIGKLILGPTTMSYNGMPMDSNVVISQGGYLMASSVFQAFLHPTAASPDYCQTIDEEANAEEVGCEILMVDDNDWGLLNFLHSIPLVNTAANIIDEVVIENLMQLFTGSRGGTSYGTIKKTAEYNQSFFTYGIYSNAIVEGTVSYYPVVSTIVGIYVLIILVIYVIATALRVVKLSVFELIAPIPILARIIPNDQAKKVFDNWLKATMSTFAEVFIRLALLFFAVLMINTVVFSIDNLFSPIVNNLGSIRWDILFIAQALVVLGVIKFVKEAPQILKDITGLDSGKYGKAFIQGLGVMGAAFGGGATATIRSIVNDKDKPTGQRIGRGVLAGLSGGARGLWQGRKTEKLGDIPKAAGTASSNALGARARREAAGGYGAYFGQKGAAIIAKGKDWLKIEDSDRIKEFAGALDNDVTQSQGVYKKSQDYIDAKALLTQMKKRIGTYEEAWQNTLQKYNGNIEQATEEFVNNYGKTIEAMRTELNAQNSVVEGIKVDESIKKATSVAAGARDYVFQLQRFSDLGFNVEEAIETKLSNNPQEAQRLINAYKNYSQFNDNPDALYEQIAKDLQSGNSQLIKNALDYVDALDMAKNHALDMQSAAAFRDTVFKAKVKDSGGDKKK